MRIKGMEGELSRVKAVLADRNAMLSAMLHDVAVAIEDRKGQGGLAQDKRIVTMYESYRAMLDANRSIATAVPSAAAKAHVAAAEAVAAGGGAGNVEAAVNGTRGAKPPFILLSKSNQAGALAAAPPPPVPTRGGGVSASRMIEALGGAAGVVDAGASGADAAAGELGVRDREAGKQITVLERRNALLEKKAGMIERNRDRDAFVMQRENARLLCEMHELQKTNMTLKRQLTNGAKDEGQDAQGAEQQPARRGPDAAAAAAEI